MRPPLTDRIREDVILDYFQSGDTLQALSERHNVSIYSIKKLTDEAIRRRQGYLKERIVLEADGRVYKYVMSKA